MCSVARREAARKGGKARAAQFTSEYQRAARARVSSESCAANGRKGARVTIERHGLEIVYRAARAWREAHPSRPERAVMRLLARLGWSDYVREYEPFPGECLSVDFAWPHAHKIVEVNGRVHTVFDGDGQRAQRDAARVARLQAAGWGVLVLDEADLDTAEAQLATFLGATETETPF